MTEAEYEAALCKIQKLMGATPGTPEDEELERLVCVVEQHEDEHYPMEGDRQIEASPEYQQELEKAIADALTGETTPILDIDQWLEHLLNSYEENF